MNVHSASNDMHKVTVTLAYLAVLLLVGACSKRDDRTIVTFWHFWSEPAQRAALDSLIDAFEHQNPTIDVQQTVLSWADGKAKLQVAFNSGSAPDVIHLGGDWFAEFDDAPLFDELPKSLGNGRRSAQWLVNARALVYESRSSLGLPIGGLCVSDPHNVIKRVLPLLWLNGSHIYQRLPISGDLTDSLAAAIWNVVSSSPTAIRDRSRQLDELLLRGEINSVLTGAWIIDMATQQRNTTLRVRPLPSILNSDVLSLNKTSSSKDAGLALIAFLCQYDNAREFCQSVSDAGFPADLARASQDSLFTRNSLQHGFLQTAQLSMPLVHSPKLLGIEPIIEAMLERCYSAKNKEEVVAYVRSAREQVLLAESR